MDVSYAPNLLSLVSLAIAAAAGLVAAGAWWRRRLRPVTPMMRTPPPQVAYRDAPTVRIRDSQRVDRMRKCVSLKPGQAFDMLEPRPGLPPRFRISLRRIVMCDEDPVAHIVVEFGGAAVSCGPLVQEIGFNEYMLPRASRDEARNAVYHYQETGESLDFMRIKLRSIDAKQGWAAIDVMMVAGHWPAA